MKTSGILAFIGFMALCADCEDMNWFLLSKLVGFALFGAAYIAYNESQRDNNIKHINQSKQERK